MASFDNKSLTVQLASIAFIILLVGVAIAAFVSWVF